MTDLRLVRATPENNLWKRLHTNWKVHIERHGIPGGWAEPQLAHAEKIAAEPNQDRRYGIFVVCYGANNQGGAPYEAFVHINFKGNGTQKDEVRLSWNRFAPRYQVEREHRRRLAAIQATMISGAMALASRGSRTIPVRMFLGNDLDREFATYFAAALGRITGGKLQAAMVGNWLRITTGVEVTNDQGT